MTDKSGKEFEELVARIYGYLASSEPNTRVELDVEIDSPDGLRQFDVVIYARVAGIDITTVVEVRDWNKNLSVTHVDGLHSKMIGVNANKAILVARKGFSSSARKKAKRIGMDLCTAHDLSNIKSFAPKAPVVVHSLEFDMMRFSLSATMGSQSATVDFMHVMVDGEPALNLFRADLASQRFKPVVLDSKDAVNRLHEEVKTIAVGSRVVDLASYGEHLNIWSPPVDSKITYTDPVTGVEADVARFKVSFLMRYDYYFGYLNDLPGTIALDSISTARASLFFLEEDLLNFEEQFSQFTRKEDLPVKEAVNLFSLSQLSLELLPTQRFT